MILTGSSLPLLFSRPTQKYRITKRVGGGSFGDIYLGVGANGEKVRIRHAGWLAIASCFIYDFIRGSIFS